MRRHGLAGAVVLLALLAVTAVDLVAGLRGDDGELTSSQVADIDNMFAPPGTAAAAPAASPQVADADVDAGSSSGANADSGAASDAEVGAADDGGFAESLAAISSSIQSAGENTAAMLKTDTVAAPEEAPEDEGKNGDTPGTRPPGGYGAEMLKRMVQIQGKWDSTHDSAAKLLQAGKTMFHQSLTASAAHKTKLESIAKRKKRIRHEIKEAWERLMALGGKTMAPAPALLPHEGLNTTHHHKSPALIQAEKETKVAWHNLLSWPAPKVPFPPPPPPADGSGSGPNGESSKEGGGSAAAEAAEAGADAGSDGATVGLDQDADDAVTQAESTSGGPPNHLRRPARGAAKKAARALGQGAGREATIMYTDDDESSGLEQMVPSEEVLRIRQQTQRAAKPVSVYVSDDSTDSPLVSVGGSGGAAVSEGVDASGADSAADTGGVPDASAALVFAAKSAYDTAQEQAGAGSAGLTGMDAARAKAEAELEELSAEYSDLDLTEQRLMM